jgi:2-hydroxychromene-2-carboxylate isomerase
VRLVVEADQPIFYYELGSPDCYLVAETIMATLPVVPEWEPVPTGALGRGSDPPDRALIEARATALELQPMRWPAVWPPDTREAMFAATYAKQVGRAVAFSLAAFRQAFAAGRDLGDRDTVLIAAAACEMHPTAVLKGIALRSVASALGHAVDRALAAGVRSVPAIQVGRQVFDGDRCVAEAARMLGARV